MSEFENFLAWIFSVVMALFVASMVANGLTNEAWEQELIKDGQAIWAVDPVSGETTLEYTYPIEENTNE